MADFLYALVLFTLILFLAWLATRLVGARWGAPFGGRALRVLEQVPVGRDRSLMLVELAGQLYLVGSGANGMNLLEKIDDPAQVAQVLERLPAQHGPVSVPFQDVLDRVVPGLLRKSGPGASPTQAKAPLSETDRLQEQIERLRRFGQK